MPPDVAVASQMPNIALLTLLPTATAQVAAAQVPEHGAAFGDALTRILAAAMCADRPATPADQPSLLPAAQPPIAVQTGAAVVPADATSAAAVPPAEVAPQACQDTLVEAPEQPTPPTPQPEPAVTGLPEATGAKPMRNAAPARRPATPSEGPTAVRAECQPAPQPPPVVTPPVEGLPTALPRDADPLAAASPTEAARPLPTLTQPEPSVAQVPPPSVPATSTAPTFVAPQQDSSTPPTVQPGPPAPADASPPPAASLLSPEPALRPPASADPPAPARTAPRSASPTEQLAPVLMRIGHAPDGAQRLTLRLDPPELGQVQVRIDRPTDLPARVEITVEKAETLTLLLRDQPQLQRALDQAGVPVEGRSVTFHVATPDPQPRNEPAAAPASSTVTDGQGGEGSHDASRQDAQPGRSRLVTAEDGVAEPGPVALTGWARGGLDITA